MLVQGPLEAQPALGTQSFCEAPGDPQARPLRMDRD